MIKECQCCGTLFDALDGRDKYCSEECRREYTNQQKRINRKKTTKTNKSITEINLKAKELGMSYGQYVAKELKE